MERTPIRLKTFDYNANGAYFVTVCTQNRRQIFWQVGADIIRLTDVKVSPWGMIAKQAIKAIPKQYPAVSVDKFVIMPDHIHLLVTIQNDGTIQGKIPSLSTVIGQMKRWVSKEIGESIWQKGFYEHVIRGYEDYTEMWKYIDGNIGRWLEKRGWKGG